MRSNLGAQRRKVLAEQGAHQHRQLDQLHEIACGRGAALILIPIMSASYDGLPPDKTDQASAVLNTARNTSGSIDLSLVSNALWDRERLHQSRLVGQAIPSSVQCQDTLHQVTNYFTAQGSSLARAHQQAIQWVGQQVQAQASFLGYMDAFWLLMLLSLAAIPLALTLHKVKRGGAAPLGH
jgi:MFS transporter, DHA2 family, multidrug resistance protein